MSKQDPRTDYLDVANVDDLARILMALVQETWAMRDRMAVTEKLLEEKAGITAAAIDDYVADEGFKADIEKMRDRFVAKVVGAPIAARERSVDQILARAGMQRPT
jgi:hypothetical protein